MDFHLNSCGWLGESRKVLFLQEISRGKYFLALFVGKIKRSEDVNLPHQENPAEAREIDLVHAFHRRRRLPRFGTSLPFPCVSSPPPTEPMARRGAGGVDALAIRLLGFSGTRTLADLQAMAGHPEAELSDVILTTCVTSSVDNYWRFITTPRTAPQRGPA